jgi:hypothetical protein
MNAGPARPDTVRLLVALTAMRLLHRQGNKFSNAADVDRFLVSSKPGYVGPWMLFGKPRWEAWGHLTEHLRRPATAMHLLGMYDDSFTVARARSYH